MSIIHVGQLCLGVLLAWGVAAPASATHYQGCFSQLNQSTAGSHWRSPGNTNSDCAAHCSDRGYILAVTRLDICYCLMSFPELQLTSPLNDTLQGQQEESVSPCNMACAGSMEQTRCMGDECCGGMYNGLNTYSVYAVGGIDVVSQIRMRIRRSIIGGQATWLTGSAPVTSVCRDEYTERVSQRGRYIRLDLTHDLYTLHGSVNSVEDCKARCNADNQCRSITYITTLRICTANKVDTDQAVTLPSKAPAYVYDRNCTYNVDLETDTFALEMINMEWMLEQGRPTNIQPLNNEDFELDLTNSNQWDSVKRHIAMDNAEEFLMTTQSGFEASQRPTSKAMGFSLSSSSSMSTSSWFSTASSMVSSGFNSEMENSFINSNDQKDNSPSESKGNTTKGVPKHAVEFFSNGYHKKWRAGKVESYEYSMTVPALHRGKISFFVEDAPQLLHWRATFMLNGYVMVRQVDISNQVHVSRLLRHQDRQFHAMGTVAYDRRTVMAKTQLWDKHGKLVKNSQNDVNKPPK